ncbi:MAG: DUF1802 family protein [Candidatus Omnitrophota bacterium]|nr:DUF1802 family protein [Candidatus Omnitrophota bacterium]
MIPSECAIALKEWATVLQAMAHGEQLLLVRKGGLIEPGSGFKLRTQTFVFYPTFEHQAVNYLREPYRRFFEEAVRERAPEGQVRVEYGGTVVSSHACRDPHLIERLNRFHIYNDAFVSQRLKWQPDQPMAIVVVRAFRLSAPRLLPVSPRYGGCTSWVDLESCVPLSGAQPILEDSVFCERLNELSRWLGPVR